MRLVHDPNRVEELAAGKSDDYWDFRSFLKQRGPDAAVVDEAVHRHYEEVSRRIDCLECGNCCRKMVPVLAPSDVSRLSSGLGIPEADFTQEHLKPGQDAGTFEFTTKPCPLLSGNTCTAYDHRPDVCRSFPHLHKSDFVFKLFQAIHNCSVCPIVYNVYDLLMDELWDGREDASWDEPEWDW